MMMHANMMMEGVGHTGKKQSSFEIAQAATAAKFGATVVTGAKTDQPKPLAQQNKGQGTGVTNTPVVERNVGTGDVTASKAKKPPRPLIPAPEAYPDGTVPAPELSDLDEGWVMVGQGSGEQEIPKEPLSDANFLQALKAKFGTQKEKLFNTIADLAVVQVLKEGLQKAKSTDGGPKAQLKALANFLTKDLDKKIDSALKYVKDSIPDMGIKALTHKVKETILNLPIIRSLAKASISTNKNAAEVIEDLEENVQELEQKGIYEAVGGDDFYQSFLNQNINPRLAHAVASILNAPLSSSGDGIEEAFSGLGDGIAKADVLKLLGTPLTDGYSVLHFAVLNRQWRLVDFLLKDLNSKECLEFLEKKDPNGCIPLYTAALKGPANFNPEAWGAHHKMILALTAKLEPSDLRKILTIRNGNLTIPNGDNTAWERLSLNALRFERVEQPDSPSSFLKMVKELQTEEDEQQD
jgi:hypothetical protein